MYCAQSSGWDGGVQTSMPITKQFQLSVDFPTEVCSYSIFYIQISRFCVDLSEISAKMLSSQSQINKIKGIPCSFPNELVGLRALC